MAKNKKRLRGQRRKREVQKQIFSFPYFFLLSLSKYELLAKTSFQLFTASQTATPVSHHRFANATSICLPLNFVQVW